MRPIADGIAGRDMLDRLTARRRRAIEWTCGGAGSIGPGLLIAILLTMAAAWGADRTGMPVSLAALLAGLFASDLLRSERADPGVRFASGPLFKLGIILFGARLTIGDLASLDMAAVAGVIGISLAALAAGYGAARMFGATRSIGLVAGTAVAICGVSAALTVSSVLGDRRIRQAETARLLIAVTLASATATILYPMLSLLLHFDDRQAGFLFGATIHDVAQAIGAGSVISPEAAQMALIVKLLRVSFLVTLATIVAATVARSHEGARFRFPWFLVAFIGVVLASSAGLIPATTGRAANVFSDAVVLIAITATGMKTSIRSLDRGAWREWGAVTIATLVSLSCGLYVASRYVV